MRLKRAALTYVVKKIPVYAINTREGKSGRAPTILNLSTR
jgi:hypothetical protein